MKASKFFLFSFLFLIISSLLVFEVKEASAVSITHFFKEDMVCSLVTTTFTGLTIIDETDFSFIDGRKYLIMANAEIGADANSANIEVELRHGTTVFEGSDMNIEPVGLSTSTCADNMKMYNWSYFTVWAPSGATEAGEDIIIFFEEFAGDNMVLGMQTIMVMEISESLTEDTGAGGDWIYNESTTDTTLGTSWDTSNDATVTFTPATNNNDWLVMCTTQLDTGATNRSYESRINAITDSDVATMASWEGEDATNDKYVQTLQRVFTVENSAHTFECEAQRESGGGGTHQRLYTAIFAIDLDQFETTSNVYENNLEAVPDTITEVYTLAHQPTTAGDTWILATNNINGTGRGDFFRMQVDNVDQPFDSGRDDDPTDLWDANKDIFTWWNQSVENLSTASHNIDVDLSDASSGISVDEKVIMAVSFELASAGAPVYNIDLLDVYQSSSTVLGSGTAICLDVDTDTAQTCSGDLQRDLDYRFEIEVDNSGDAGSPTIQELRLSVASGDVLGSIVTADIIDAGCSTTTGWTELVTGTTARGTAGTTCEISTSGTVEFWMIVNIDPDAEGNSSLSLHISDGTVTDTSELITFNFGHEEPIENPMTMTDDQRFDVSIKLDNPITMTDVVTAFRQIDDLEQDPITMTDEQHYDISIIIENPMTMTDVMTPTKAVSVTLENPLTMTDDERFDTSIRLDNPITMTDVALAERTAFTSPENPITMTDNQRFDISIIIENPMTMTDVALAERTAFATLENPLTLTDEQHYDISIIIENPMTMTDVVTLTKEVSITIENPMTMTDDQRFDTSIRLDNPITMTDDVTAFRIIDDAEQDPLTLTDEQHYDISIIIENPMTMTDNQRFDTSIRLDNPITMTDDVTPTKFLNALNQDPLTLTDDQRYDISIIIENPMTMTDVALAERTRFVTLENPMTMTDDMNIIFKEISNDEQDPITITDEQHYDISIIIENPMTMTDVQEFDTSIKLDNPITMTDVVTPTKMVNSNQENPITMTDTVATVHQFQDDEQDPITMTDVIRLDTSIIIENPMTVTDDQRFDTSIRLDNPMRMTDIMTPDHTVSGGIDNFETIENPMTLTQILTLLCVGVCPEFPLPPSGGGGDPTPIDPDSDGDGIVDSADACPLVFGTGDDGCPVPVIDVPEEPLQLQPLDFTIPFEFNELDVVDDYITLETDLPQPQVEDLAIRWLGDDQITITSINIGESPFEIQVSNIPITFGSVDFGFTQTQLIYTVQEPDKICGDVFSFDCLDEVTYEIPVVVTGVVDGKTIIADGSITIDNSGRTNPYWLALFGLLAVPILALLFWRRRRRLPKQNFTVLRKRELKETAKAKPQKSGTTRKLLKVTSKSRISGKTKSGSTRNLLRDTAQ